MVQKQLGLICKWVSQEYDYPGISSSEIQESLFLFKEVPEGAYDDAHLIDKYEREPYTEVPSPEDNLVFLYGVWNNTRHFTIIIKENYWLDEWQIQWQFYHGWYRYLPEGVVDFYDSLASPKWGELFQLKGHFT